MTITIRDSKTFDEFDEVRQIQQRCWGFTQGEGLYAPILNTAAHNGGVVLGAFDDGQMIGYLFGFLGLTSDRRLKLCSQTMGVLPEYRNRGVAAQLKWAQRTRMLDLGIELITWTFDPLEAPNARLNLHTLGAVASAYQRNLYGDQFGALGRGLPSDRFHVAWWINEAHVAALAAGGAPAPDELSGPLITECTGAGVTRRLLRADLTLTAPTLHVEIPANVQAMKQADLALALDWRWQTRTIFETYLARGYVAVDLVRLPAAEGWQVFYRLQAAP